jgi:hypothetical protein
VKLTTQPQLEQASKPAQTPSWALANENKGMLVVST